MATRMSSINCQRVGTSGVLDVRGANNKKHPLDGADVFLVTDRYSGYVVQLVRDFGGLRKGSQVQVAPHEFLTGALAELKRKLGQTKKPSKNGKHKE